MTKFDIQVRAVVWTLFCVALFGVVFALVVHTLSPAKANVCEQPTEPARQRIEYVGETNA